MAKRSPSSKAGKYVREEMHHIREGKHGARSAKQAIAIGLSKARKAGVRVPSKKGGSQTEGSGSRPSQKRSRAISGVLKREPRAAASHRALSRQSRRAAGERGASARRQAAQKAVRSKGRRLRVAAARKAARSRKSA